MTNHPNRSNLTKYGTCTPPEKIRPGTRKSVLRREYEAYGEAAMRKLNAEFKKPIKDASLASWLCYWHYLEECHA